LGASHSNGGSLQSHHSATYIYATIVRGIYNTKKRKTKWQERIKKKEAKKEREEKKVKKNKKIVETFKRK
jgi:hypothetical protein